MKYFALLLLLLAGALNSCSHPSAPVTTQTNDTTISHLYSLTGSAEEIDVMDSRFDTVFWYPASLDTIRISGSKEKAASSGLSGSYYFDSLPAGNYNISCDVAGFAPAYLHVTLPRDSASQNTIHLFPVSWMKATIEKVWADSDNAVGLHIQTRLTSTDPRYPSLGSVYLFLDTNRGIDPVVASSYDLVYNVGNSRDSLIDVVLAPGVIHAVYGAGVHVYCTAFASPYGAQFTYSSRDSDNRPIYPYFGAHPGNTVEFNIP